MNQEEETEEEVQVYPDEARPPPSSSPPLAPSSPSSHPSPPSSLPSPSHEHTNNQEGREGGTYTNSITISLPSNFSLHQLNFLWDNLLHNIRARVAPLLFRRSIVFYCVVFLLLQLILMLFYQHRAYAGNAHSDFKSRRMEPAFEKFVSARKDSTTNTTTVLFAEPQNIEWIHNLVFDLKKLNMHNYIIFARDKMGCAAVDRQDCYVLKSDYRSTFKSYKFAVWQTLLDAGVNVLAIDHDVILLENPILYFDHTVDLNIMVEYPSAITSRWTLDLERAGLCCSGKETYYNSGFFYLKSSPASLRLLDEMKEREDVGLQEALNLAMPEVPNLKVRALDRDMFSNGFVGFLESSPNRKGFDTIAYKLNWADASGKFSRARELLHWHLDPIERYSAKRKYLTYSTEDDYVPMQVEHDFLALAYYIAKTQGRSLIIPKFHCYVGEPANCGIDALFDPALLESTDVFEHSFLRNPAVPHENLERKKLSLRRFPTVPEITDYLDKVSDMPLIDLTFPKVDPDGSHLSLEMIEDRASTDELAQMLSTVERSVRLNANGLFSSKFTIDLQRQLNSETYTCVVTHPFKLNTLVDKVKETGNKMVYVVTHEPTLPTHKEAKKMLETKLPNAIFGHESMWAGHRLLSSHTAPAYLQMNACAQAEHVIVNSWEPAWLIGGICDMRRVLGKSECINLQQDPWLVEPWKSD